jgi:hypothetical protein
MARTKEPHTITTEEYLRERPGKQISAHQIARETGLTVPEVTGAVSRLKRMSPDHYTGVNGRRGVYVYHEDVITPEEAVVKGDDFLATVLKVRQDGSMIVADTHDDLFVVTRLDV